MDILADREMPCLSSRASRIALAVLTLAHLVNHVYAIMHLALIPVFMSEFGLDIFAVSLIVATPLACQFLMTIPSGVLADRIGGERSIVLSLLVTAAGAALASQASNTYVLIVSLVLLALATTLYHPPGYSAASEVLSAEHRSLALGLHGAGGTLGVAIGPISIGMLLSSVGWRHIYLAWMVPVLVSAFLCWRLKPLGIKEMQLPPVQDSAAKLRIASVMTAGFLALLGIVAAESIGGQLVSTFLSPYLVLEMKIPVSVASIIVGLVPLMGIIAAPTGGVVSDKLGERQWIAISYIGIMLSIVGIAFSRLTGSLVACIAVYGYFTYSGMGAKTALVARFAPLSRRGIAYAFFFLPSYAMSSVAPIIGASIAEDFRIWSVFPIAAGMVFIALVVLRLMPVRSVDRSPTSRPHEYSDRPVSSRFLDYASETASTKEQGFWRPYSLRKKAKRKDKAKNPADT